MPKIIQDDHLITRREFTLESALALLAGVTITVSGCGDDDPPISPTPTGQDFTGSVSANHGHAVTVTAAQITLAGALSLDIRSGATHPHTLELTQDEVRRIGARTQVAKASSTNDGHEHTVTFN